MTRLLALALAAFLPSALWASEPVLPGSSLYYLEAPLVDQHGQAMAWTSLKGKPQLVSLFYASCHMTCPLILESAKQVQQQLPTEAQGKLGVAMVSLDPKRDTPEALLEVAQRHRLPSDWRLLRTEASHVRVLASALGIQYRFRPDGSINHSSELILLDENGTIVARTAVEGIAPDPQFVRQVQRALSVSPHPPK
jgi:protein SCO1/2